MGGRPGPKPSRASLLATCLAASFTTLLWAPAAIAADLTGHWRGAGNVIVAIEQSGTTVTLTSGARVFEGTIDGNSVEMTGTEPLVPDPPFFETYSLVLSPDESVLEGVFHTMGCVLTLCNVYDINVTFSRCACFDGNENTGDGCDFQCQVEPCHACTGDPSTCTPLVNSTPCEHRSQCISGGTCSDGECVGGVQTASCIDMGGGWLRATHRFIDGSISIARSEILQDGGDLSIYDIPGAQLETTGTLDASSRALAIGGTSVWPYCSGTSTLDGTLSADGNSFSVTGWYESSTPRFCVGIDPFDQLGLRCAPSSLEPSDGCLVDSCQTCSGDPPVCVPVPDATPCRSSDPCTVVATCEAGECVAAISDECPVCSVCDGAGGCTAGPRNNCRQPDEADSTMLALKHADPGTRSSLRWGWKDGGAIRGYDLARPDLLSDVAFCLFDESTPSPALLFAGIVNDNLDPYSGLNGDVAPGWTIGDDGSARYRERDGLAEGITSLQLDVGAAGDSRIKLKGRGAGLLASSTGFPTPALPLPLRAQLQIEGGACFEGRYDAAGVSRNTNGVFRAKGTP